MTRNQLLISGAVLACAAALSAWWFSPQQMGMRVLEALNDDAVRSRYGALTCRLLKASGSVTCTIPTSCGAEFTFGLANLGWFSYWADLNETRANLWATCPEMISDTAERERAREACEGAGTPNGIVETKTRQEGECVGP